MPDQSSLKALGLSGLTIKTRPITNSILRYNNLCFLQAHQNDRQADNHIIYKRFDEAVVCHKNASELLLHAMQLTTVTRALEALQLQYEYHKRQEDIVQ